MKEKNYDLLLKSFDSKLSDKEQNQLDQVLLHSESLRIEKERLEFIRQACRSTHETHFRPFLAERVLAKITSEKRHEAFDPFFESLKKGFKPLAAAAILLIIGSISLYAIQNDQSILSNFFPSESNQLEQAFDPTWAFFQE